MTSLVPPSESQTLRAPASEVALASLSATSNASILSNPKEASWWSTNFGLSGYGTSVSQFKDQEIIATRVVLGMPNQNTVNDVKFSLVPPYYMAVATGPRVLLYNPTAGNSSLYRAMNRPLASSTTKMDKFEEGTTKPNQQAKSSALPDKTIPFPGPVYKMAFRLDGRLIALGGHEGVIRVVDIRTKSIMRSFALTSKSSIRALHWLRDGIHLLSAGDDGIVHVWDISQPSRTTPVLILKGHGDSVRDMIVLFVKAQSPTPSKKRPAGSDAGRYMLVTGSYDHSLRVWDLQAALRLLQEPRAKRGPGEMTDAPTIDASQQSLLSTLFNGVPIESMAHHKGYNIAVAGGTAVKLWNVSDGTLVRENDTSHSKTITRVCFATSETNETRMLTCGLDGFMRIYNPDNLACMHGSLMSSPLISLAMSPYVSDETNRLLVTGTVDGHVLIHQRTRRETPGQNASRGLNDENVTEDYTFPPRPFDYFNKTPEVKALRQFRYGDALDAALKTQKPDVVCALLEELSRRRSALDMALANRDEETLEPILMFCFRYLANPEYTPMMVGILNFILDIYQPVLFSGQSVALDQLMEQIRTRLHKEMITQRELMGVIGQLEGIMTVADMKHSMLNAKN